MENWLTHAAQHYGRKIAFWHGEIPIQYGLLYDTVTMYRVALQRVGVRPGDRVALLMDSDTAMVWLFFALMDLEAVSVPLNTRLSVVELAAQIEQANCKTLICDDAWAEKAAAVGAEQVLNQADLNGEAVYEERGSYYDPSALLSIVFTSGTSGQPKGVMLTYGNFYNSALASAERLGTQPDDNWLCPLPLYHVGGLNILVRSLIYGTSFVLDNLSDMDSFLFYLQGSTLVSLVPTQLYRLIKADVKFPSSLRCILLGGAAASDELLEMCRERKLPIATTYGLTEACSQVATATPDEVYAKPGTLGKPLNGTQIRIVDEAGQALKNGDIGEIVVSGKTVMKGYYQNPEATAKALHDGELFTGDIGYLDADDDLFVLQRRTDLIVSGGENVYPVEVEAALRKHPAVEEACVVGIPHPEWGQQVAAAVVRKSEVSEAELTAFCRDSLAGYKLPRRFLFVEVLPQTASGKILRRAVVELFR
jgi:o-succinylbenzoate---CoA ligase